MADVFVDDRRDLDVKAVRIKQHQVKFVAVRLSEALLDICDWNCCCTLASLQAFEHAYSRVQMLCNCAVCVLSVWVIYA